MKCQHTPFLALLMALLFSMSAPQALAQYVAQYRPELEVIAPYPQTAVPLHLHDIAPPTEREGFGLRGPVRQVDVSVQRFEGGQRGGTAILKLHFSHEGDLQRVDVAELRPPIEGEQDQPQEPQDSMAMIYEPSEAPAEGGRRWNIRLEGMPEGEPTDGGHLVRRLDDQGRLVYRESEIEGWFGSTVKVEHADDGTASVRFESADDEQPMTFDTDGRITSGIPLASEGKLNWDGPVLTFAMLGEPESTVTVRVNDRGHAVMIKSSMWGESMHIRNTYDYDKQGNWVKLVTDIRIDEEDWETYRVIKREIRYAVAG